MAEVLCPQHMLLLLLILSNHLFVIFLFNSRITNICAEKKIVSFLLIHKLI